MSDLSDAMVWLTANLPAAGWEASKAALMDSAAAEERLLALLYYLDELDEGEREATLADPGRLDELAAWFAADAADAGPAGMSMEAEASPSAGARGDGDGPPFDAAAEPVWDEERQQWLTYSEQTGSWLTMDGTLLEGSDSSDVGYEFSAAEWQFSVPGGDETGAPVEDPRLAESVAEIAESTGASPARDAHGATADAAASGGDKLVSELAARREAALSEVVAKLRQSGVGTADLSDEQIAEMFDRMVLERLG